MSWFLCSMSMLLLLGTSVGKAHAHRIYAPTTTPIKHFINIMQENHTFDNYFGTFPGADGIPPNACMPVNPFDPNSKECVQPFHIGDKPISDLDHSRSTARLQFNHGRMDGFIYAQGQRNLDGKQTMGYYDGQELPYYWNLAKEYVLFDHFYSSSLDGSFLNHLYWVTASPGNAAGRLPPGGYGDLATIFDRLEERGITWKFYVQNYDPRLTYRATGELGDRASQVIWVPLLNFDRYIFDARLFSHIVDLSEYFVDLRNGTLPEVAYMVPSGASEHPPGRVQSGMKFVKTLIQELQRSKFWYDSAFLLAYDDWGGWYDHVSPTQVDEFGLGFRVPAILVSPYARRGYIDHTEYEFASILRFIEDNWDLEPLTERDARANSIVNAFDFTQPARQPQFVSSERIESAQRIPEAANIIIYTAYGLALILAAFVIVKAVQLTRHRLRHGAWRIGDDGRRNSLS